MRRLRRRAREIKRETWEIPWAHHQGEQLSTNASPRGSERASQARQMAYERRAFWNSASANLLLRDRGDRRGQARLGRTRGRRQGRDQRRARPHRASMRPISRRCSSGRRALPPRAESRRRGVLRAHPCRAATGGDRGLRGAAQARRSPAPELAFFSDSVDKSRRRSSRSDRYRTGLDHMRTGRWHEAAVAFEDAIRQKETASHTPSARLNLAAPTAS